MKYKMNKCNTHHLEAEGDATVPVKLTDKLGEDVQVARVA